MFSSYSRRRCCLQSFEWILITQFIPCNCAFLSAQFSSFSHFNSNVITTSLTYEELLPFIIDPSWNRLRKICFTTCWIIFFVILLIACISSFMSMSKVSCGVSSLTASDNNNNESVGRPNVTSQQGILAIVLNSNATVTT